MLRKVVTHRTCICFTFDKCDIILIQHWIRGFVSIERSLVYFAVCAIYGVMRCIVATATTTTTTTKTTTLSSISSISRYTSSTAIRMATEAALFLFLATGFLCGMIWNSRFVINTLSQMINTFVRAYHHKGKHKTKTGWNVDILLCRCCWSLHNKYVDDQRKKTVKEIFSKV